MPARIVRAIPWDGSWPCYVADSRLKHKNLVEVALERDETETFFQIDEEGAERKEYLYVHRSHGLVGVCLNPWNGGYWFPANPTPATDAPIIRFDTHWGEPVFPRTAVFELNIAKRIVLHYVQTGERADFLPWQPLEFDARQMKWVERQRAAQPE